MGKNIVFSDVMAAHKNAREITEAFIKEKMLDYNGLYFDKKMQPVTINGSKVKLMCIYWNEDDNVTISFDNSKGELVRMPIEKIKNDSIVRLAEIVDTMSVEKMK